MLAVNISKLVWHPAASPEGPSAYTSGSGHITVFGLATSARTGVEESDWAVNFIRKLPRPILKTEIVRQSVANGVGLLSPIAACLV
jgi:hypothetical protein